MSDALLAIEPGLAGLAPSAGRLYGRLRGRLRQELLVDRERSGRLTQFR
ncbi:hypothetical protein [Micromonospora wenchangensis]